MPFVKGQSGNPRGRQLENEKLRPITAAISRALLANDGQKLRKLADSLIDRAIEASDRAASEVLDRVEGKVPQALTGPDGGPIQVQDVPWLKGRVLASR